MSFKLSKSSLKNIEGIHPYLQLIVKRTIELSNVDFGIIHNGGYRTVEMQQEIYKKGNSKCDGIHKRSKHQEGMAVDLVPYIDGKYTWNDKKAFIDIYTAWEEAETQLKKEKAIPEIVHFHHGIYWNWKDLNMDGQIDISDRLGWDSSHHSMETKPQRI